MRGEREILASAEKDTVEREKDGWITTKTEFSSREQDGRREKPRTKEREKSDRPWLLQWLRAALPSLICLS